MLRPMGLIMFKCSLSLTKAIGAGGKISCPFIMKKTIITFILLLFIQSVAFGATLMIPVSCWPLDLQKRFAESGRKLDLTASERTKDSWGYVFSKGDSFELYTYNSPTTDDFNFIQEVVFEIEKEKKELDG